MRKTLLVSKVAVVAFAMAASSQVSAETVTGRASVVVNNTFSVDQDDELDFGVIGITVGSTTGETDVIFVPADKDMNPTPIDGGETKAQILTPGSPGKITVTGAGANANLYITFPTTDTPLEATNIVTGAPTFIVKDFTAHVATGSNAGEAYNDGNLTTDAQGSVSFTYGATLTSVTTTFDPYEDDTYAAEYQIEVTY